MEERREYLLALDGGTGSFRAILFQKNGVQKAIEQIEWEHPVYDEYPGSVGFDFEKKLGDYPALYSKSNRKK